MLSVINAEFRSAQCHMLSVVMLSVIAPALIMPMIMKLTVDVF
jgi:hypothetical protein